MLVRLRLHPPKSMYRPTVTLDPSHLSAPSITVYSVMLCQVRSNGADVRRQQRLRRNSMTTTCRQKELRQRKSIDNGPALPPRRRTPANSRSRNTTCQKYFRPPAKERCHPTVLVGTTHMRSRQQGKSKQASTLRTSRSPALDQGVSWG